MAQHEALGNGSHTPSPAAQLFSPYPPPTGSGLPRGQGRVPARRMACTPTPTLTLYTSSASTSILNTFTQSVTTVAPVVTTITTQTCSAVLPDSTGESGTGDDDCVTVDTTVVSTLDGKQIVLSPSLLFLCIICNEGKECVCYEIPYMPFAALSSCGRL